MAPSYSRGIVEQVEEVDDISAETADRAARTVCSHLSGEDPELVRDILSALGLLEPLRQKRDQR